MTEQTPNCLAYGDRTAPLSTSVVQQLCPTRLDLLADSGNAIAVQRLLPLPHQRAAPAARGLLLRKRRSASDQAQRQRKRQCNCAFSCCRTRVLLLPPGAWSYGKRTSAADQTQRKRKRQFDCAFSRCCTRVVPLSPGLGCCKDRDEPAIVKR